MSAKTGCKSWLDFLVNIISQFSFPSVCRRWQHARIARLGKNLPWLMGYRWGQKENSILGDMFSLYSADQQDSHHHQQNRGWRVELLAGFMHICFKIWLATLAKACKAFLLQPSHHGDHPTAWSGDDHLQSSYVLHCSYFPWPCLFCNKEFQRQWLSLHKHMLSWWYTMEHSCVEWFQQVHWGSGLQQEDFLLCVQNGVLLGAFNIRDQDWVLRYETNWEDVAQV